MGYIDREELFFALQGRRDFSDGLLPHRWTQFNGNMCCRLVHLGMITYGAEIDDMLDELGSNIVGDAIKEEDHAGKSSPILLLPANKVLLMDSLGLECLGGGRHRLGLDSPGTLDVKDRPGPRS